MDYFLQRKFFDLAKVFSKETGIEPFSDIDIHLEINDILVKINIIRKCFFYMPYYTLFKKEYKRKIKNMF